MPNALFAKEKVSVVIPCFNEVEGITALFEAIQAAESKLHSSCELSWVFVNDGSTDGTGEALEKAAPALKEAKVVHHQQNKNLGAALRTGIESSADCDYIAFFDSDCTYSFDLLPEFIEALRQGADFVTASPYHPKGKVIGVSYWRLFLSRSLSFLYRILTGTELYTYTAMVRAIRFESAPSILPTHTDFSAVTEMLLRAIQKKAKIAEVPAELHLRRTGTSKMRVARTILAHLKLIGQWITGGVA